eukprot:443244-Pyramimonas_sp.AAC.4
MFLSQARNLILASHEDYSTVRPLQKFRKTAVISQLRDPVDRVISAYEFAGRCQPGVPYRIRFLRTQTTRCFNDIRVPEAEILLSICLVLLFKSPGHHPPSSTWFFYSRRTVEVALRGAIKPPSVRSNSGPPSMPIHSGGPPVANAPPSFLFLVDTFHSATHCVTPIPASP